MLHQKRWPHHKRIQFAENLVRIELARGNYHPRDIFGHVWPHVWLRTRGDLLDIIHRIKNS